MLKKITLASLVALSMASAGVAVAAPNHDNHRSLVDRQNDPACQRPTAPNICFR
jgi:hypothetical protein